MPRPQRKGRSARVADVKTIAPAYTAVRFSVATLVFTAMVGSSVILAALLIRMVPMQNQARLTSVNVSRSADGAVIGEVLVKFKPGTSQLTRTKTVNAALVKPVRVTTLSTVKKRVGFRTVTQTSESVSQRVAKVRSITPAFSPSIKLTEATYDVRAKRGNVQAVASTAATLAQWFVVKVDPPTADLGQIASALRKQANVVQVETNRHVRVAATRSIASTTSGAAIRLADAQQAAQPLAGDVNGDAAVDGKDLRLLVNYLLRSGTQPSNLAAADITHDGRVDISDLTALISLISSLFSAQGNDLTSDGLVNWDDVNYLTRYLFQSGAAPQPLVLADLNADGGIDISDLSWLITLVTNSPASDELLYGSGDANGDGVVDNRDLDFLIAYLTGGGPAPSPLGRVDMDVDGNVDITDLTYLISLLTSDQGTVLGDTTGTVGSALLSGSISDTSAGETQPVIVPSYLLGDCNADGRVTPADLHALVAYLFMEGPAPSPLGRGDMDGSGTLDISDVTRMVKLIYDQLSERVSHADLNGDGVVNSADLRFLVSYLFEQGPAPDVAKADLDGDGRIDITDVSIFVEFVYQLDNPQPCEPIRTVGTTHILTGDVNASGTVTPSDAQALASIVYADAGLPSPVERADVNCDGSVTPLDLAVLDAQLAGATGATLPGDANSDGAVDTKDLVASALQPTDVNEDGVADIRDTYALVRLLKLDRTVTTLPDVDGDGRATWADADALLAGVFTPGAQPLDSRADVNGDASIDAADALSYVSSLARQQPTGTFIAGDANADSVVDCRDVQFLHATFFQQGPKPSPELRGDVSGDGQVTVADALLLAQRTCSGVGSGTTASDVLVALLDSGANLKAASVAQVLVPTNETLLNRKDDDRNGFVDDLVGYTTYTSGKPTVDCNGHGSALTSLIAGSTGVARHARVLPIKVVDCKGLGSALGVANGLVYAAVRGADVSVLPVSGVGTSRLLADVVAYTRASGMLVVGAAGNDGVPTSRVFPANVSGVVSVGATVANGKALASYSNTSATVVAPGTAVGVAFEGTSVSTAYVAGTAALILGKAPGVTLQQLEAKLIPPAAKVNPKVLRLLDAATALTK